MKLDDLRLEVVCNKLEEKIGRAPTEEERRLLRAEWNTPWWNRWCTTCNTHFALCSCAASLRGALHVKDIKVWLTNG